MNKTILALSTLLVLSACGAAPESKQPVTNSAPQNVNSAPAVNPLQDKPMPTADFKASMQLVSDKTEGKVGQTLSVRILVSGAQKPVTTANAVLRFDPALLEATKVDTGDSKWTLAFKNESDNKTGMVTTNRSEPAGVSGNDNLLAVVTFKVLKEGSVTLSLDPDFTTLLLSNNASVTPRVADLPSLNAKLTK